MKKGVYRRFLSAFLVVCLTVGVFVYSSVSAKQKEYLTLDEMGLYAMWFIANDIEYNNASGWNKNTEIKRYRTLYDENDEVTGYSFELSNKGGDNGYIVVSETADDLVVQEFSYEDRPLYYANNVQDPEKVYYTGPLEYAVEKQGGIVDLEGKKVDKEAIKSKFAPRDGGDNGKKQDFKKKVKHFEKELNFKDWMLGAYKGQAVDSDYAGVSDVYGYVNDRYGTGWSYKEHNYLYGVPALLQSNSDFPDVNDCTLVASTAIFKYYRDTLGLTGIPSTLSGIYNDIRDIALDYGYTSSGGTPPTKMNNIIDDVWDEFGYSGGDGNTDYVWSFSAFKSEIDNDRPFLLNIANGYYANHTVAVVGYLTYSKSGESDKPFLKVHDNWTISTRFIDKTQFNCCGSIVKITPP